MNHRKAKWIISGVLFVLSVAVTALIVTKLSDKKPSPENVPTEPAGPQKTVTVWLLSEAVYINEESYSDDYTDSSFRGTQSRGIFRDTFSYDELGRCIESASYQNDRERSRKTREYLYDEATQTMTVITTSSAKQSSSDKIRCDRDLTVYDFMGRTIRDIDYTKDENDNWTPYLEYTYRYLTDTVKNAICEFTITMDNRIIRRSVYDHLSNTLTTQEYSADSKRWITTEKQVYDFLNRLTAEYVLSHPDNKMKQEQEYRYHPDGSYVHRYFWYAGSPQWYCDEFDADGRMTKQTRYVYGDNNTIDTVTEYTRIMNPDGGYTDIARQYDSDGTYLVTSKKDYASDGDLLKGSAFINEDDGEEVYYLRELDEQGHPLRETITGRYASVTDFTCDENGNCIKAVTPGNWKNGFKRSERWEYTYIPMVLTEEQLRLNNLYPTTAYIPTEYPTGKSRYSYFSSLR